MIDWWVAVLGVVATATMLGFELWRSEQRAAAAHAAREREQLEAQLSYAFAAMTAQDAQGERDRLRVELLAAQGALEDFGAHADGCAWRPHMDAELDCTCGLVDAKERARKAVAL